MGILDNLAGKALGGMGGGSPMIGMLLSLINRQGGLSGLVGQFQNHGLGNVIQSWIGTGENLPINSEQIRSVFGDSTIQDLSNQSGMAPNDVTSNLSRFLPEVVNRLTPGGNVPEGQIDEGRIASSGIGDLLGGLFGKKSA